MTRKLATFPNKPMQKMTGRRTIYVVFPIPVLNTRMFKTKY